MSIHMKASERLFTLRILTGALSILFIALAIHFYNEYVPDLLVRAEQIIAASMGNFDTTVASR